MGNISQIIINNSTYDLRDPHGISVSEAKGQTGLNNAISFNNYKNQNIYTASDLLALLRGLSQQDLRLVQEYGHIEKILPVGSVLVMEEGQKWVFAGIIDTISETKTVEETPYQKMEHIEKSAGHKWSIFLTLDEYAAIAGGSDHPSLNSIIGKADTNPNATVMGQTARVWFSDLLTALSDTVRGQFEQFLSGASLHSYAIREETISSPIATLANRVCSTGSVTIANPFPSHGYKYDGTRHFEEGTWRIGLLNSTNVFGSPVFQRYIGKMASITGSNGAYVFATDDEIYEYGGLDTFDKLQFPIFKQLDNKGKAFEQWLTSDTSYTQNILFHEKRLMALRKGTTNNVGYFERYPTMTINGSTSEGAQTPNVAIQGIDTQKVVPYIAIEVGRPSVAEVYRDGKLIN